LGVQKNVTHLYYFVNPEICNITCKQRALAIYSVWFYVNVLMSGG